MTKTESSTGEYPPGADAHRHTRDEELARQVIHLLEGPVVVLDVTDHILLVNQAAAEAIGSRIDELSGCSVDVLFKDQEVPNWLDDLLQRARSNGLATHEGWVNFPSIGRRFIRCRAKCMSALPGESCAGALMMQCRDLTQQHELDTRRRRSLDVQERMLGHLPAMVWVCGEDGKPFYYNRSWLTFTGLSQMEALRDGWLGLVHEDEREITTLEYRKSLATRDKLRMELRVLNHCGEYQTLLVEGTAVLDSADKLDSYILTALPISDYQALQSQLATELADAKQSRDAALHQKALSDKRCAETSAYLALASHEIRTPLNPVIGFADLLASNDDLDQDSREMAQMILRAGRNLLSLIDDILDYAKIESGGLKLTPEVIDVHDLVLELEQHHRFDAQSRGIDFELQSDPQISDELYEDRMRLHQVLSTVLNHLFKITPEGTVRLQALADKEENSPGNDFLRFLISSDAVHPGEHNAEEIFQPFRRNHGELDAGHQSSGLSLAIARRLVEMMSGTITAGFTANNGCEFEILIPHRREPGKVPSSFSGSVAQSSKAPNRKPLRASVLIIDDEGSSRKVHRSLMEFLGFGCHEAAGVEELKSRLSEQPYELILLDLMMPGMDGFEIARRLRDGEFGESNRQAFIVAVTSCMEESIRERIRTAGMNEYISKPLTTQELRRTLHNFREHRNRAFASNAG